MISRWARVLLFASLAAGVALLGTSSPARTQGSFDASVTALEVFTKNETDVTRFIGSASVPDFDTAPGVVRFLRVDSEFRNGDVAGDLVVSFVAAVNPDCSSSTWAPRAGDLTSEVGLPSGSKVLELRTIQSGLAASEMRPLSRFLAVQCADSDATPEILVLVVTVDPLGAITDINAANDQLQKTIQNDEGGGLARAAGFAAPAITTDPAVIARLTFDCIGAPGSASGLPITVNELKDGTAGDPQPITAAVQNGTVTCVDQTTVAGGTWNFAAASTGNVVEIIAAGLPAEGLGAADVSVAFDSAVLNIASCDTGDLAGACNPNSPGGPAQAAGFAAPAITTEPAVIARLTFDCVGTPGSASDLTITVNELKDGTAGDPQPITAVAQNGTVTCVDQTTIAGGTWNFAAGSTGNVVEINAAGLPFPGLGAADISVAFNAIVLDITACDSGDLDGVCNPNAPGGPIGDSDSSDGLAANILPDEDDDCPSELSTPAGSIPGTGIPDPYLWNGCPLSDLGLDPLPSLPGQVFVSSDATPTSVPVVFDVTNFGPDATSTGVGMSLFARTDLPCLVDWQGRAADSEVNDVAGAESTALLEFKILDDPDNPAGGNAVNLSVGQTLSLAPISYPLADRTRFLNVSCSGAVSNQPLVIDLGVVPLPPQNEKQVLDDPATAVPESPSTSFDECVDTDKDLVPDAETASGIPICSEANNFELTLLINASQDPELLQFVKLDGAVPVESIEIAPFANKQLFIVESVRNSGTGTIQNVEVINSFRHTPTPGCTLESGDTWSCDILQQVEDDAFFLDLTFNQRIRNLESVSAVGWGYLIHPTAIDPGPPHEVTSPHGSNSASGCESDLDARVIVGDNMVLLFGAFGAQPLVKLPKHTFVTVRLTVCPGTGDPLEIRDELGGPYPRWLGDSDPQGADSGNEPFEELEPSVLGCWKETAGLPDPNGTCNLPTDQAPQPQTLTTGSLAPSEQEQLTKGLRIVCSQTGMFVTEIVAEIGTFQDANGDPGLDSNANNNSLLSHLSVNCSGVSTLDASLAGLQKLDPATGSPIVEDGFAVNVDLAEQIRVVDVVRNVGEADIDSVEVTNTYLPIPAPTCVSEGSGLWACDVLQQVEGNPFFLELTFNARIQDVQEISVMGWTYLIHPVGGAHGATNPSGCESGADANVLLGDATFLEVGAPQLDEGGNPVLVDVPKHEAVTVRVATCPGSVGGLEILSQPGGPYPTWKGDPDPAAGAQNTSPFQDELEPSLGGCWKDTDSDPADGVVVPDCTLPAGQEPQAIVPDRSAALAPLAEDTIDTLQIPDDPGGPDSTEPKQLKLLCKQPGTFTVQIRGEITDVDPGGSVDRDTTNNSLVNTLTVECTVKHEVDLESLLVVGPIPLTLSDTSTRQMWVSAAVRNPVIPGDGGLPETITTSLEVSGVPTGCDREERRLLPPVSTLKIPNGEARPFLFRVSFVCHAPAQPLVYLLTITVTAELASGESQVNVTTPTNVGATIKALVLVEP